MAGSRANGRCMVRGVRKTLSNPPKRLAFPVIATKKGMDASEGSTHDAVVVGTWSWTGREQVRVGMEQGRVTWDCSRGALESKQDSKIMMNRPGVR